MTQDQEIEYMQIPNKYLDKFHDDLSGITQVLVVEKDTVFQRLIQMQLLTEKKELLIVTAKGYPDYATRRFLRILW